MLQNPVQDVLQLKPTAESLQAFSWYVVDVLGGVRTTVINIGQADVSTLAAGTYYLVAQKEGQRQILPFVKL